MILVDEKILRRHQSGATARPASTQMLANSPKYSWSSLYPPSPSPKDLWLSTNSICRIQIGRRDWKCNQRQQEEQGVPSY
jgi:hypothetical protein